MIRKSLIVSVLFASVAMAQSKPASAPATQASQPARTVVGCWQAKEVVIRIEPNRLMDYSKGRLSIIHIARIENDKIVLQIMGQSVSMKYKIDNGDLLLTETNQQEIRYTRLPKTPPELADPTPLQLGKADKLSEERVKTVQDELEKRFKDDQSVRSGRSKVEDVRKVDADNAKYLKGLVGELGWIDVARFGSKAAIQALLLAQHSEDLGLMMSALAEVKKDVKAQTMDAQGYAMLHDRLQLVLGEKQRYGTQVGKTAANEYVILPLEDPAKVNEFRKEIGLVPLEEYIKELKKKLNAPDIKVMEEK